MKQETNKTTSEGTKMKNEIFNMKNLKILAIGIALMVPFTIALSLDQATDNASKFEIMQIIVIASVACALKITSNKTIK